MKQRELIKSLKQQASHWKDMVEIMMYMSEGKTWNRYRDIKKLMRC